MGTIIIYITYNSYFFKVFLLLFFFHITIAIMKSKAVQKLLKYL